MPKVAYIYKDFSDRTLATIAQANRIIAEYAAQGFVLTLRQLYYQFVARGLIPNKQTEYKRLGSIVNDGRLAGLIDWSAIEDRTRNLNTHSHWNGPADIVSAAASSFALDRWRDQDYRVEVWVEKEALVGVFAGVCGEVDLDYFACRGYTSQSELWGAARRLAAYERAGKKVLVLHFGDHDPSGIDMTRDIEERLRLFECGAKVRRLALNMDQVEEYAPPPNPAKETDSRFEGYMLSYGDESWELDALEPAVLAGLVRAAVDEVRDPDRWAAREAEEEEGRDVLVRAANRWNEVERFLEEEE